MRWVQKALLGLALLPASAQAQDSVFTFDTVLVAPVQSNETDRVEEARRIEALLKELMAENNDVVPIEDVPNFDDEGYTARIFVENCPAHQYSGCAMVVGQKVETEWVIGGTLAPVDSDLGTGGGESVFNVSVIDIRGGREVMAFGVVVGGATDDTAVLKSVVGVYDQVVGGAFEEVDVRGDIDDPKAQAALEKRRQEIISASLANLENDLGGLIRADPQSVIETPKITRKELKGEYETREDTAPWERLGLSQAAYVRYQNTGIDIDDFRKRLRGRFGQVLVRAAVGGGPGPWGMHHEGRWIVAQDEDTGQPYNAEVRQYQEVRRVGASNLDFELGFGVAPFAEVSMVYGMRTGPFTYRIDQDVLADGVAILDPVSSVSQSTTMIGARVLVAPLPTYQIRPTVHLGVVAWQGAAIDLNQDPLVALPSPNATFLQMGPGVEMSAGSYLNVFLRGHGDILMSGQNTFYAESSAGTAGFLQDFDEPLRQFGGGFTIQGGIQVRLSVLKAADGGKDVPEEEEWEPDF